MKKQELLAIRPLRATVKMLKVAADLDISKSSSGAINHTSKLFMRCCVEKDILKVAFYFMEHLRSGGRKAVYELFISKQEQTFLTYECSQKKWLTSMLYNLNLFGYHSSTDRVWISTADSNIIKRYLGISEGNYETLSRFQQQIRHAELKARHRKETDPWDADLARTPDLPKDWERWTAKVGIPQNYIYYQYDKNGARSGYCTFCDKDVPIKQPRHNATGHCPRCHKEITFKSIGKAGTVITDRNTIYLMQRCTDGFIIREFIGYRKHVKGAHQTPECVVWEIRRAIYPVNGQAPRAYFMGMYKQCESRWIETTPCSPNWNGDANGRVYGKTIPSLAKSELRHTGLPEMLAQRKKIDPEKYLAVLKKLPPLEQIAKANLARLTKECVDSCSSFEGQLKSNAGGSLTKLLGIDSQKLKRLRANNGGKAFLSWLQYEKSTGRTIPDAVITWFCKEKIKIAELNFIRDQMSMEQICNYVRRQMREGCMSSQETLTTWADYLSMAKRLGMDTNDSIIFRVRKLRQRHDELVLRCQDKERELRAGEILEKYPHVNEICQSLTAKYAYADEQYTILAPTCVEDIIQEGESLIHCLSGSDRYWDRIERHEAYILFLRRSDAVDTPYYTLEIEPGGTVRQKRTKYDRQEADIEEATLFLAKWQKVIVARMTENDKALAAASRILRQRQFEELRNDKVIIHTGALCGKLLVDVLMADLMEVAA